MKKYVCCICGNECVGYGNNAAPVKEGYCCNECNSNVVIPIRIEEYFKSKQ